MPEDDTQPQVANHDPNHNNQNGVKQEQSSGGGSATSDGVYSLFKLPKPIKQVFDRFPLQIYPPNELPGSAVRRRDRHVLYVFARKDGARAGQPSFNPACLKWQAYLRFHGIRHSLIPSTNHASPTGALPFLIPANSSTSGSAPPAPIPASKLPRWVSSQSSLNSTGSLSDIRLEAYTSLLDHRLRAAWLHTLYLSSANFDAVALRLYISPSTSSPLVQTILAKQLQSAAHEELLKLSPSATPSVNEEEIYTESRLALEALSTLLGPDEFFFGAGQPGLFDASVFAYTYLILDPGSQVMNWKDKTLKLQLERFDNLIRFTERISEKYFPSL